MKPLKLERYTQAELIYEDLELINNLLWLSIDTLDNHQISELSHVRYALLLASERAWEKMTTAKQLQDELYQEFLASNQQSLSVQQEVQA